MRFISFFYFLRLLISGFEVILCLDGSAYFFLA